MDRTAINEKIWQYYAESRRDFPWRQTTDPYRILVSEIMLQQTQTGRVVDYYERFTTELPNFAALAKVNKTKLLRLWQGLGYNRRALNLQRAAEHVISKHNGKLPTDYNQLVELPGVGPNTAGAILAYAFNQPAVFIETNIRKTIIHYCFPNQPTVSDKDIRSVIEKLIDRNNPREWYWAVVDYGSMLGRKKIITNSRSQHHRRQSAFIGSDRFIRSSLLKIVLERPFSKEQIIKRFDEPERAQRLLIQLEKEGFIKKDGSKLTIA